jgi:hypothetical protein
LVRLRWQDLHLDTYPPTVTLRSDHRLTSQPIPLSPDITAALRSHIETSTGNEFVFERATPRLLTRMLRADLSRAGIVASEGERFDFSLLRMSAISWWYNEYQLPCHVVMRLARRRLYYPSKFEQIISLRDFSWLEKDPQFNLVA